MVRRKGLDTVPMATLVLIGKDGKRTEIVMIPEVADSMSKVARETGEYRKVEVTGGRS